MNLAPSLISATTPSQVTHIGSDRHCVVRCQNSWYAFPATAIREITYAPPLASLPGSHPLLAGICHLRSEFLPVIRINLLLSDEFSTLPTDLKLLVLGSNSGNWGILVSEVAALEALETLSNSDMHSDDPVSSVVQGTAMFRDEVVRVLDPIRLQQFAQVQLQRHWHAFNVQSDPSGIQ